MEKDLLKDLFEYYVSMVERSTKTPEDLLMIEKLKNNIRNGIESISNVAMKAPTDIPLVSQSIKAVEFSELIEAHSGGKLITILLDALGVKKSHFCNETGLGATNIGYLSLMLKGTAPITQVNAERFAKWFESRGVYVPINRLVQSKKTQQLIDPAMVVFNYLGKELTTYLLEYLGISEKVFIKEIATKANKKSLKEFQENDAIDKDLAKVFAEWFIEKGITVTPKHIISRLTTEKN